MARKQLGTAPSGSTDAATKGTEDAVKAGATAYVNHGATAGTARPSGYAAVVWIGSVEPTNASNGDIWLDTA